MTPFLRQAVIQIFCGAAAGGAIAFVDNVPFRGEVSPFVIVVLLFAATALAGIVWGVRGSIAAGMTWVMLPAVHAVKHAFGLHDTLHPNNWLSILYLGLFTLVIAAAGLLCGMAMHPKADSAASR